MTYDPTPKQEQAIREWIDEAITPLIVQVLVKKLGQAMSFAAQEVIQPKCKPWVELTADEMVALVKKYRDAPVALVAATETKLREKNT